MTRTARTPASTADQADPAALTAAAAGQPQASAAGPLTTDLKAMLQQAVVQLSAKRDALLKARAEVVGTRLRLLEKPVGADDIKRLAFAPIDQRARDFTTQAGWSALLTAYAYPKGERPELSSYRGGSEFARTVTGAGRTPLCVGDMLALRAHDGEAVTPRGASYLAGVGGSDFSAGAQDPVRDSSRDRYPQGGEPTISRPPAPFDGVKHLTGLICFLAGDILKQRIADFIDRNLAGSAAGATVNWPEVERQLGELSDRIAAFDRELTQVDTELADLPVSCAECNEARYRLGLPVLDQAASLAANAAQA